MSGALPDAEPQQYSVSRYLKAACAASVRLTAHQGLQEVIQAVGDAGVEEFDAALAQVWLRDTETGALRLRAAAGLAAFPAVLSDLAGEAARAGRPFVINDLACDSRFGPNWAAREGLRSAAVSLLVIEGELLGVLVCSFHRELPSEAAEVLETFSAMAAAAIRNAQLFQWEQEARREVERERDLARGQAHLLDIVEQAVMATNAAGEVTYWNRAAERLYGWTAGEALGRSILELTPAEKWEDRAREIIDRLEAGESWSGEFLVRRNDGSAFPAWVTNAPIRDADGAIIGVVGVSSDISERKRLEEALRSSEEQFRTLVEQSPLSIQVLSPAGWTLQVNRAWERSNCPPTTCSKTSNWWRRA